MQQQQLHQAHDGRLALETKAGTVKTRIRDVWKHNLAQEMAVLRHLVEKYPYISMVCSPSSLVVVVVVDDANDAMDRTRNSPGSLRGLSGRLPIKPTITIRPCGATLIC